MNRVKMLLLEAAMLGSMACGPYGHEDRHCEPRPDTSDVGGGYHHDGIYSQPKKLRKGAGHKKLTRAQRRRLGRK